MTRSELIQALASKFPTLTSKDVELAIRIVIEEMSGSLANKDRVEIRGFGSFATNRRPARAGRNPKTGESVMVPPKDVPHFKAGKELRERVDSQRNDHGTKHITPAGGNVFLDLGFEPEEAAKLLAESDKRISETLANKERLDKVSDDVVRAESEFNGRARKIGVQKKN